MAEQLDPIPDAGEPSPTIDVNELVDLAGDTPDPIAEELTTEKEEPEPVKEPPIEEPVREEPPSQAAKEAQDEIDYKAKATEYEQQLEFYRTLYGDEKPPVRTTAAPVENQPQQQGQDQPKNLFDYINPSKEELYDLMSGEPEKATPVIRRFLAAAVYIAQHNVAEQQKEQTKVSNYIGGVQKVFYEKYPDLDKVRPLVKMAGDQVAEEWQSKGIRKLPHELIDDIGKRAYQLRSQLVGGNGNPAPSGPKKVISQGEVGGTKVAPPAKVQLTDQQKEMLDILDL